MLGKGPAAPLYQALGAFAISIIGYRKGRSPFLYTIALRREFTNNITNIKPCIGNLHINGPFLREFTKKYCIWLKEL